MNQNAFSRRGMLSVAVAGLYLPAEAAARIGRGIGTSQSAATDSPLFVPTGIGATARTVRSKLSDSVSVRDFGAVGDGRVHPLSERFETLEAAKSVYPFATSLTQTLDWAGVQAALDTLAAQGMGGSVHAPRGRYLLGGDTITATKALRLFGDGKTGTVFVTSGAADAFRFELAHEEYGLALADFGIRQSDPVATVTAGTGLRLKMAYLAIIENIQISGFYHGLRMTQSPLSNLRGIHVDGFRNAAMLFDGGQGYDVRVSDFTIAGGNGAGNPLGTYAIRLLDMCDEFIFRDGVCSTSVYGMATDATVNKVSQRPEFCRFDNISFDNCTHGIDLNSCTDMLFVGCFFSNRPTYGAQVGAVTATENVTFIGCNFFANGSNGAQIGPFAKNTSFMTCNFADNGQFTPGAARGLWFFGAVTDFAVEGCTFRNGQGGPGSQSIGMLIEDAGCDRFTVTGNNFGTGPGADFVNAATGTDQYILGNIGFRTHAAGSVVIASGKKAVTIAAFPTASYRLAFTSDTPGETYGWSEKTTTGFTITSSNPSSTARVDWTASS